MMMIKAKSRFFFFFPALSTGVLAGQVPGPYGETYRQR